MVWRAITTVAGALPLAPDKMGYAARQWKLPLVTTDYRIMNTLKI